MKFLIDTDWIIKFLRGNSKTVEVLSRLYDEELAVNVISFSEIYEGIYRFQGKKREELEENFRHFLNGVDVLDVNEGIGKVFA